MKVILALGKIAHDSVCDTLGARKAPHPFKHGVAYDIGKFKLISSYHCSRYNTNTGVLTTEMFEDVVGKAKSAGELTSPAERVMRRDMDGDRRPACRRIIRDSAAANARLALIRRSRRQSQLCRRHHMALSIFGSRRLRRSTVPGSTSPARLHAVAA